MTPARADRAEAGERARLRELHGTQRFVALQRLANNLFDRFHRPVYLVGSALRKSDPRDYDLRIRIDIPQFRVRFGDPERWRQEGRTGQYTCVRWRWSDECVKRTRQGWRETRLNVDVQLYPPAEWARYQKEPRVRLDTRGRSALLPR